MIIKRARAENQAQSTQADAAGGEPPQVSASASPVEPDAECYCDPPGMPPPAPKSEPTTENPRKWVFPFAAYRPGLSKVLPREMVVAKRYISWSFWSNKGPWKKEPRSPFDNDQARSINISDEGYWAPLSVAEKIFEKLRRYNLKGLLRNPKGNPRYQLDGVGFVLGGGFAGIDLDNCLAPVGAGRYDIASWAAEILDRFPDTYAELSPSRTGVKIFLKGELVEGRKGAKRTGLGEDGKGAIEIYDRGRYFTVTGLAQPCRIGKLADYGAELNALHAEYMAREDDPGPVPGPTPSLTPVAVTMPSAIVGSPDDDALLTKARRFKNGAWFVSLFDDGDISQYHDDDSQADLALCGSLAFLTGKDSVAMDRLFRRSALFRPKWERAEYRDATIREAIAGCKGEYRGARARPPQRPAGGGPANTVGGGFGFGETHPRGGDRANKGGEARPPKPGVDPETLARVKARIAEIVQARNLPALYDDPTLIADLAAVKEGDYAAYLMATSALKAVRGFSKRELDRLIASLIRENTGEVIPIDNPHALARQFGERFHLDRTKSPHGCRTAQYHKGITYEWQDGFYRPLSENELQAEVNAFAHQEFKAYYLHELEAWNEKKGEEKDRPKLRPVTETLVRNVMGALRSILVVPERICGDMPAWVVEDHPDWDPKDILPTRNALVHLPSAIAGIVARTVDPTPALFSGFCVDYDYEPDYRPPKTWLEFLDQVFPGDQQSIDTLQEYLGYCLSSETSQHKMLMMCGAPRSGKGTIDRVFTKVIGASNRVGATLHDLGGNFSLSPWIGKQLAVITEARVSGRTDTAAIASRLLAITGEDEVSIDIKYKAPWSGRLGTRIIVIANDVPAIVDPSTALVNRFLFLHFTQSFLNKEDHSLADRLMAEVPQILNWCVLGLGRLRARGKFVQPESGLALREQFLGLSSRISDFVSEMCVLGADQECGKDELFQLYVGWCESNNAHAGSKPQFARDLYAAYPGIEDSQKNLDGDRPRFFKGVGIPETSRMMTPAGWWLRAYLTRDSGIAQSVYADARLAGFKYWEVDRAAAILGVTKAVVGGFERFPKLPSAYPTQISFKLAEE